MGHNITITIDTEALYWLEKRAERTGRTLEESASRAVWFIAMGEKPGFAQECTERIATGYWPYDIQ